MSDRGTRLRGDGGHRREQRSWPGRPTQMTGRRSNGKKGACATRYVALSLVAPKLWEKEYGLLGARPS